LSVPPAEPLGSKLVGFDSEKASVEGAALHRFRKTYADTLHEEGVSVNTLRIRLGHEPLSLTLAYLMGTDAESEEAQEHPNSGSLAPLAKLEDTAPIDIVFGEHAH
jgi:hypothetical protein